MTPKNVLKNTPKTFCFFVSNLPSGDVFLQLFPIFCCFLPPLSPGKRGFRMESIAKIVVSRFHSLSYSWRVFWLDCSLILPFCWCSKRLSKSSEKNSPFMTHTRKRAAKEALFFALWVAPGSPRHAKCY